MNKTIITTILGLVLMIGLVSATNIYAGEPYTFQIDEEYDYYSIVGNLTEIDLNVTQEGLNVTITTGKYTQSDSFTLVFFNKEKEVITEHHYSGGGGGTRKIYIDRNNTEYIFLGEDCEEDLCELDFNDTIDIIDSETEAIGFWRRFWNWFKGIFGK